jgi:regulator of nonsense transcripts 2
MRKRHEEGDGSPEGENPGVMNFTMLTKRGNKQQVRQLAIPSESALAVQTRSAQEQDKVEQQHLKRLVLDYEQREEAEEIKGELTFCSLNSLKWDTRSALEAKSRPIKIRLAG